MNVRDIETLYAYNRWANGRLLASVALLEPPDFVRHLGGSFGCIRATLVHIMWGEWLWLQRWRGESPKQLFDPVDLSDLADIEARWTEIARDQSGFIAGLTDNRLAARLSYENLQGRRWEYRLVDMLQHTANHSNYHRGQVVAFLRQLGRTPPATDYLVYLDETGTGRSRAAGPHARRQSHEAPTATADDDGCGLSRAELLGSRWRCSYRDGSPTSTRATELDTSQTRRSER